MLDIKFMNVGVNFKIWRSEILEMFPFLGRVYLFLCFLVHTPWGDHIKISRVSICWTHIFHLFGWQRTSQKIHYPDQSIGLKKSYNLYTIPILKHKNLSGDFLRWPRNRRGTAAPAAKDHQWILKWHLRMELWVETSNIYSNLYDAPSKYIIIV